MSLSYDCRGGLDLIRHPDIVGHRQARHLVGILLVADSPLMRQLLPPRDFCVGSDLIQKHVHRNVGILPRDQDACVSVDDVQLAVAEVLVFKPSHFGDIVCRFRSASVLDAQVVE